MKKLKMLFFLSALILSSCKNLETDIDRVAPPLKSAKGDGYIFRNYIYYDKSYELVEGNNVKIIIKVKNEDVEKIDIIANSKKYKTESIGSIGEYEYFEGKIPNKEETNFYFEINDGNLTYYFGEQGTFNKKEIEPLKYIGNLNNQLNIESKLWYKVNIDTFYNGQIENDPIFNEYGPESFSEPKDVKIKELVDNWGTQEVKKILGQFEVSNWRENFNKKYQWEKKAESVYGQESENTKRYGGDLKGLLAKKDYFKEMKVNTLWISSPFYSYSNSKEDIIDYKHISPDYGTFYTSNKSEFKILNSGENIEKTSSDDCFVEFLKEFHKENIQVVSDIVLDYVSYRFLPFQDVLKNGKESKYWDWFNIKENSKEYLYNGISDEGIIIKNGERYRSSFVKVHQNLSKEEIQEIENWNRNHMDYDSFGANREIVKLNFKNKDVQNYLKESAKKWLDLGLDGYVIKIRDASNDDFYKDFEEDLNKDNKYIFKYDMIDNRNTKLDKKDILNYEFVDSFQKFYSITTGFKSEDLYTSIYLENRNINALTFIEGTDIDRLNSSMINGEREVDTNNKQSSNYKGIDPSIINPNVPNLYKQAIALQFFLSGDKSVYYGSEKFMWGGDIPHNKKPMIWDEYAPYYQESDYISKYKDSKNLLDGKVLFDEVEGTIKYTVKSSKDIEDFYKKIINMSIDNKEILDKGALNKLKATDNVLIISKEFDGHMIILAINRGGKEEKIIIETGRGKNLVNILNGEKKDILNREAEIVIPAYGTLIYKKNK